MNSFQNVNNNNILSPQKIKEAFKMFCIDQKYLSLQRFDSALEYLFKPPIPVIHHTHLSKKLFYAIDQNKTGQIDENIFCDTFIKILRDTNYRSLMSLTSVMTIPDNFRPYVEVDELKKFMFNSYIEGFKILSNLIKLNANELKRKRYPIATENQLIHWAKSYESKLYQEIDNDLKLLNNSIINEIRAIDFYKWISIDHCFYLKYDFIYLPIATSLQVLNKVQFDDSQLPKMIPSPAMNPNSKPTSNNSNTNDNSNNANDDNNSNTNVNSNDTNNNDTNSNINDNKKDNNTNDDKKNDDDSFGFHIVTELDLV